MNRGSSSLHIGANTSIKLYAVACMIPFLAGGMLWLSNIDAKASAAERETQALRTMMAEVLERTIRIEEQLKWLKKQ